jgi:WXXGXW repeat (2 copies)
MVARSRCDMSASAPGHEEITMTIHRAVRWLAFGLLLLVIPAALSLPSSAQIGFGISVRIGPPALPVYEQPLCPGPGYLWTPGYWAWSDDDGYYWVPGTWVEAPSPGLLWTPGYWGWNDGVYVWNGGYWGPEVGFYGGINYGFGYGGEGFYGGEWRGGSFFYNSAVTRVNTTTITNVYVNKTVIVNNNNRVAFNGGHGGVQARPNAHQEAFAHEKHTPPVESQIHHERAASQDRALRASANHGRPAVAATARPAEFKGRGVVAAKAAGAPYHAPKISPRQARASASAGNAGAGNRAAGDRPAGNRGVTKGGTAKGNAANRPAANRPAANRAESSNAARAANRPSTSKSTPAKADRPPSANRPASSGKENAAHPTTDRPNTGRPNAPRGNESRPAESRPSKPAPAPTSHASEPRRESAPRAESPRPAAQPRPESAPRSAAPQHQSAPPAQHQSAPRESAPPKSSARPAPAPKPSAPAKQSPPKEERKNKGN